MRSRACQTTFQVVAVLGLLIGHGCGPAPKPAGNLQGAVTFDGQPVADATIQIQSSATGEAFVAKVDSSGNYKFDSPVTTGEYVAIIQPVFDVPPAGTEPVTSKPPDRKDIPEKYRDPGKSDLKVTVKEGHNTFDAKLTK